MTNEDLRNAAKWYRQHEGYVERAVIAASKSFEPTGPMAQTPELWSDLNWYWYFIHAWLDSPYQNKKRELK